MHTSVLFCKQYKRNKWLMLMACSSWNTEHDPNRMTTGTQELFVKHYWLLIYVSSIFTTSITILDFSMCIFRSFLYFVLLTTIHVHLSFDHIIDIFSTIYVSKWICIHLNHHFIMYFNPNIWNASKSPCIFLSPHSISK